MSEEKMFLPAEHDFQPNTIMLKNGFIVHDDGTVETPETTMSSFTDAKRIAYFSHALQLSKMFATYRTLLYVKQNFLQLSLTNLNSFRKYAPFTCEAQALDYVKANGFYQLYEHYGRRLMTQLRETLFPLRYREANKFLSSEYRDLTYRYVTLAGFLEFNFWTISNKEYPQDHKSEFGTPYVHVGYGPNIVPHYDNPVAPFRPSYPTIALKIRRLGLTGFTDTKIPYFHEGSHMFIIPILDIGQSLQKNTLYKVNNAIVTNPEKKVFQPNVEMSDKLTNMDFYSAFDRLLHHNVWSKSAPNMLTEHYTRVASWNDITQELTVPYNEWCGQVKKTVDTNVNVLWNNYNRYVKFKKTSNVKDTSEDMEPEVRAKMRADTVLHKNFHEPLAESEERWNAPLPRRHVELGR